MVNPIIQLSFEVFNYFSIVSFVFLLQSTQIGFEMICLSLNTKSRSPLITSSILLTTSLTLFTFQLGHAQTQADLIAAPGDGTNVLMQGMGYNAWRFSPLKKINVNNVKKLVPVWNMSTNNSSGDVAQPLLYDGIIYYTTGKSTYGVDAISGRMLWKHELDYASDVPMAAPSGLVNRGPAIYEGILMRTTLDAHVVALDIKTGKPKVMTISWATP